MTYKYSNDTSQNSLLITFGASAFFSLFFIEGKLVTNEVEQRNMFHFHKAQE